MQVYVDPDECISCGLCIDICPDIFHWNDDEIAEAESGEVPEELGDCAKEALESCPVEAIKENK